MSQKSHKSCQERHMNIAADARAMVAAAAGERAWGDTRESWLAKAARRLRFTYPRTRSIFYQRAVVTAEEWCVLQETMASLTRSAAARQGEINDLQILARSRVSPAVDPVRPPELEDDAGGKARLR